MFLREKNKNNAIEWNEFIENNGYSDEKIEKLWKGKGYLTLHNNFDSIYDINYFNTFSEGD